MVKIKRQIVPTTLGRIVTSGSRNSKRYIVIHETANLGRGANAQAHANLQSRGNSRQASWHYQVDEKEVIQSFEDSAQCWHAGNRYYNLNSIGIEICVNVDGDYRGAVSNAAELTKSLMKKYNIPASNVIQHNHASGKNCPTFLRNGRKGVTWNQFKNMVSGSSGTTTTAPSRPSTSNTTSKPKPVKATGKLVVDGKWGQRLTASLQKHYGTPQDGILSGQHRNAVTEALYGGVEYGGGGSLVIKKLQEDLGEKQDGLLGPATIMSLQIALGSGADGIISRPNSAVVRRMQETLNAGTFNPKRKKSSTTRPTASRANISVDGKWGSDVNRALQQRFGTHQDGILSGQLSNNVTRALYGGVHYGTGGSLVIRKLQAYLGITEDGLLGPGTVRALQTKFGTRVDGVISRPNSVIVREMQKRLNNGTF